MVPDPPLLVVYGAREARSVLGTGTSSGYCKYGGMDRGRAVGRGGGGAQELRVAGSVDWWEGRGGGSVFSGMLAYQLLN